MHGAVALQGDQEAKSGGKADQHELDSVCARWR